MSPQRRRAIGFMHVGLVVDDFAQTVRFLELLGLRCDSAPEVFQGEWIDRIVGLEGAVIEVVVARTPGSDDVFEVMRFRSPRLRAPEGTTAANSPGLRHVAFTVDDLFAVVERIREAGWATIGEIVNYEDISLLCYVRGPEGLIVELVQRLGAPD